MGIVPGPACLRIILSSASVWFRGLHRAMQGTEHTVFAPARASGPPFKAPAPFRAPTPPGPPSTLPDPPPSPSAKCTQATFPCILALY